jgi:proline iminopeptidase
MWKKILVALLIALAVPVVFALIMFLATAGDAEIPETAEQGPSIPHIEIDGHVFHSEAFGDDNNDVVVVVHGGPGGDYRYLLPLEALADDYYVVFYDQRGTGLSPRVPAEELTLESSLEDLDRVIDYYAPNRKVNVIGHSWGAMLASGYLGRHPERIDKIVLAEPGMLTDETVAIFEETTRPDISLGLIWLGTKIFFRCLHIRGPDEQARGDCFYAQLMTASPKDSPLAGYFCPEDLDDFHFDYWRFGMTAFQAIPASGRDEDGRLHIDLVQGVDRYPGKVLFLSGECNTLIGPEHQQKHLKYFPDAELIVIEGAGHNMFTDRPEESIAVVRDYLRN